MLKLEVVLVSTRPARMGAAVAHWFLDQARAQGSFDIHFTDLAELDLPMFDEPRHPRLAEYEHAHTRQWSQVVDAADAFAFVTPEYNHSVAPSLVNALDYLSREWAYKPAGFASYGGVSGGTRGVVAAKTILNVLKMVPIVEAVSIPFFAQHMNRETGSFDPGEEQAKAAQVMLAELHRWATALRPMREG